MESCSKLRTESSSIFIKNFGKMSQNLVWKENYDENSYTDSYLFIQMKLYIVLYGKFV